jgi:hypothetical protein
MASKPEYRSYEELSGGFTWAIAEKELEYKTGMLSISDGTAATGSA